MSASLETLVPTVYHHDPIFGSTEKLCRTIVHLRRLEKLSHSFSSRSMHPSQSMEKVQLLWEKELSRLKNPEATPSFAEIFKNLTAALKRNLVFSPYEDELNELAMTPDLEKLKNYIQAFVENLRSIQAPPLTKSYLGTKGPTFLVRYFFEGHLRTFVIKWCEDNELACNHLYHELSLYPEQRETSFCRHVFFVPQTLELDFKAKLCTTSKSQSLPLPPETSAMLFDQFYQMTLDLSPGSTDPGQKIMLSEMINGSNLFDFAKTEYVEMPEQDRKKLFNRLGRLAFLDLVAGNLDRLIEIVLTKEGFYQIESIESNPGNVLILKNSSGYSLFAIDNGIDPVLTAPTKEAEKYLVFLETILTLEQFEKWLSENFIASLNQAILNRLEDEKGDVNELKKQFTAFLNDLKAPFAREEFEHGVLNLAKHLLNKHFEPSGLFLNLEEKHPELVALVRSRISLVQKQLLKLRGQHDTSDK
ncbi:MAG: hypothetical protein WC371_04420 [Parachlamydiales bacterium]|jgi:hypothetical protein